MFELCKKVEVYNIYNNYYFYTFTTPNHQLKQKLALHLLRPAPISSLLPRKNNQRKNNKKGIKLSKTMAPTFLYSYPPPHQPPSALQTPRYQIGLPSQLPQPNKAEFSRLRTDTEYSGRPFLPRQVSPANLKKVGLDIDQKYFRSTQKIQQKLKPNCHARSISNSVNENLMNPVSFSLQKQVTQSEGTKNLSDTKPASSKIQTTCTNNLLFSSQYIVSKYEPQHINFIRESFENSQSKLISISKSVSSVHETSNEKDNKKFDLESEISKSGREISINLSNIFSKQETFGNDHRKSNRESPAKRSIFWQDSDRHTIQSRFSREGELGEELDVKIEESILEEHNAKQNFKILESNQIRKKDYVLSQALEHNINITVSLKELLSIDPNLIVEEMHVYELIEKYLSNSEEYCSVLQLYQVQRSQDTHILIKQPYEMSLQAKIKQVGSEEGSKLRERAKMIGSALLQFLERHKMFPTRKMTTHEFVFCWGEPKIHDLSFFKGSESAILSKDEVLAGIDI